MKNGREISIKVIDIKTEISANKIDSVRNCSINLVLLDPSVFFIPTSLALVSDLAVVKFIKFIIAKSRMKNAIAENM